MGVDNLDPILRQFEFSVNDLKLKYDSKQSSRLLANNVWMVDHIENKVKVNANHMNRELESLQNDQNTTIQNNAVICIKQIQEVHRFLDNILFPYKNRYEMPHIEQAWRNNLPLVMEKMKSLRHRVDIIKNTTVTKKKIEEEDWYGNL